MLGVVLLYVGAVLMINGYCGLANVDKKATAVMQIFAGVLGVIVQVITLVDGNFAPNAQGSTGFASTDTFQWYAAATGLLFAFTYLWQAANNLFNLDVRPYGFYCGFVGVNAIFCSILSFLNFDGDWRFTIIWLLWALLWFTATIEIQFKKPLGKFVPVLAIFCGVVTAWVPGMMMLVGIW